jgi:hypothetical protein
MGNNQTELIAEMHELLRKLDCIGPEYVNTISAEIYDRQPFFLTVLLGYRFDVLPEELDEIMRIYFLIWEYFKKDPNIQKKKVGEENFNIIQRRHIQMFKYAGGESEDAKLLLYSDDWNSLRSKALVAAIIFQFTERPVLTKMNVERKAIILVGIKSFIECFEGL